MRVRGWAWGLSQCGRWWIIQTSTQITQDSPSVPGHCWKQQRAQQPDLPTAGQLAPRAAHTLALSYFLASSSSLLTFPFFTVNSYSFLSHLARSVHNQILKGFCFNTIPRLYLGGDCSCPWFEDGVCRWAYFDWFHLSLLLPAQSSAIMMRRPTNGPCSTRIYCRKDNKNKVVSAISSARLHF